MPPRPTSERGRSTAQRIGPPPSPAAGGGYERRDTDELIAPLGERDVELQRLSASPLDTNDSTPRTGRTPTSAMVAAAGGGGGGGGGGGAPVTATRDGTPRERRIRFTLTRASDESEAGESDWDVDSGSDAKELDDADEKLVRRSPTTTTSMPSAPREGPGGRGARGKVSTESARDEDAARKLAGEGEEYEGLDDDEYELEGAAAGDEEALLRRGGGGGRPSLVGDDGEGRRRRMGRAELERELASDDPVIMVKKAVPETDDPMLPALTLRAMVLGLTFCTVGAAVGQLFFYKSNSPGFSTLFVILITLPLGRWMARALPDRTIDLPFGLSVELNPGPFSIKEHLLVAVITSSGASSAYASDIINIQELFYHHPMGFFSSITLLLTTQCLGFGFAGMVHNILVKPVSMVFPSCLLTTTMFHTLHSGISRGSSRGGHHGHSTAPSASGGTSEEPGADVDPSSSLVVPDNPRSRLRFFIFVFVATLCYQFLPNLLMPALSSIAVLCLLDSKRAAFRILSSGYKGLGILNFSLDWTVIGSHAPFVNPWWASVNHFVGLAGAMWVVMPLLYFSNFWEAQSFPSVLGAGLYSAHNHSRFDVGAVMRPEDNTLDRTKWERERPILLTPWFALSYGIAFATLTSTVSHVLLWHWRDIKRALFYPNFEDVHNRLMRAYHPVPSSWYLATLVISLGAATLMLVLTPSLQLPIWGLLLAVGVALTFVVPVGILKAVSNTTVGLNVITEFVAGYLMPGYPVGNVLFKCMGYMAMSQALDLATDMKLAHYMKIPPRSMFIAQLLGTAVGCFVNLFVVRLVLNPANGYRAFIEGTAVDPTGQWTGRKIHIFYSASVIWGAIGPAEFFAGKYRILYLGFIVGALAPVVPWVLYRRLKRKWISQITAPIVFHAAAEPPQIPTNVIFSGFLAAYVGQYWLRKRHPLWHARRSYVLSAALDAGSSVNALVVFILSITVLRALPLPHWALNPARDSEMCHWPAHAEE